jgi:phosphatidylserine/phosphatidylglycerophosphate/cardiolipin synthase-like enzyme
MRRLFKKIRKLFLIVLLLAVLSAGAAIGLYFHRGGKAEDLPGRVAEVLDQGRDLADRAGAYTEGLQEKLADAGGRIRVPSSHGAVTVSFAPMDRGASKGVDSQLVDFIEGASDTIYAAFYDLQLLTVADALIAQHKQGRTVEIVSDTEYLERAAVQACIAAGIPVVFDKRSAFMHNKFCVVDGRYVWTGSANVTENGMYKNNNNVLLIESPDLAMNYTAEFKEMFEAGHFGKRSPKETAYPEVELSGVRIENYFSPEDGVAKEILEEIEAAEETIDFMAFSYTSSDVADAMVWRARKGVRVRGLFESRNANSRYSKDEFLQKNGATIYLDTNPATMHHKVIIIDDETVITGSYNFSNAAEQKNDENVLIIHSEAIAQRYTEEFESLTGQ